MPAPTVAATASPITSVVIGEDVINIYRLYEEHNLLRRRVEINEERLQELRATNTYLLHQNEQLRRQSQCSCTSTIVNPVTLTTASQQSAPQVRSINHWIFDFNCAQSEFLILLNSNKSSMRSQSLRYKCKPLQSSASLALPSHKHKLLVVRRWQLPQIRPKASSWRWQVHNTQERMLVKYLARRRLHLLPVCILYTIWKIQTQLARLANFSLFLLQHHRWESRWIHRNR